MSATVFEVTYDVALKPLPYPNAERLVQVSAQQQDGPPVMMLSGAELDALSKLPQVAGTGGFEPAAIGLARAGAPQQMNGALVTGGLFSTLGVPALLGRSLGPADALPGAPATAVLSYAAWTSKFGADPHVLGRRIELAVQRTFEFSGRAPKAVPFTIVGVMPPRSKFPFPGQLWVPLVRPRHPDYQDMMGNSLAANRTIETYVRLRRGVDAAAFRQSLASAHARLAQAFPELAQWRFQETPLRDEVVGSYRERLLLWLAASICLLLLTCLTVSNLMMGRARSSAGEGAVRLALGATRPALVRQSLALSGTIAVTAGLLGVGIAYAATALCAAYPPPGVPRAEAIAVSWPVLAALLAAAVLLGLLFGLLPAAQFASPSLQRHLQRADSTQSDGHRLWGRSSAVAVEVGLAYLLTLGAILAAVSLGRLGSARLGYPTDNLIVASITPGGGTCPNVSACNSFVANVVARLQAAPGIKNATVTGTLPLGMPMMFGIHAHGASAAGKPGRAQLEVVGAGYFRTMGLKILAGRGIQASDGPNTAPVAVISRGMARELFGNAHALGRSFSYVQPVRVVGIAGDVSMRPEAQPHATFYVPLGQAPYLPRIGLVVRATRSPRAVARELPGMVASVDPGAAVSGVAQLDDQLADVAAGPEYQELIFAGFGGLGILLALAGVYGLVRYQTGERAREFAVRTALGAKRRGIVALALAQTLALSCMGLAAGLACYLATAGSIRSLFYGAVRLSPGVVAGVGAAVFAAAALAALPPALHAASAPVMEVLREG